MRKTLFMLSIIWIAVGLFYFPFIFFIGLFAGSVDGLQRQLVGCVLLFSAQLIIQSILALIFLKQIKSPKQFLFAVLLILVPFLIVLPVGLSIGMHFRSNLILYITLSSTFLSQLLGSIWIWILISKRSRETLVTDVATTPQKASASDGLTANSASQQTSLTGKSRKKLDSIVLLTPLFLFILGVVLTAIATKVNPEYYTLHISTSFPIAQIADAMGTLSGMLIIPCVIIGTILLAKK